MKDVNRYETKKLRGKHFEVSVRDGIMEIWAIDVGEYSDYKVVGYCTSEESAKKRCAILNGDDTYSYRGSYGCFKMDNMDCGCSTSMFYGFMVWAWRDSDGYRDFEIYSGPVYSAKEKETLIWRQHINSKLAKCTVRIYVRENNEELAKKAALDALYKEDAESEGVV